MKDKYKDTIWAIIIWLFTIILTAFLSRNCGSNNNSHEIEYVDSNHTYHQIYTIGDFDKIKDMNKELYDSLKKCQDKISYLLQFDYRKHYSTGQVVITKSDSILDDTINTFVYESNPNDTFAYKLEIGAYKEPLWYSLDVTLSDKLTIVDKIIDENTSHTTIDSENNGEVSNTIIYKQDNRKKFWERFHLGPAVIVGYDPINKNFGMMVGMGLSFDL